MSKPKKTKKPDRGKIPFLENRQRRLPIPLHHLIAIGLIGGVALVAYSNTFYVPFLFDDLPNITQNPNIQIKVLTLDRLGLLIKNTYQESIRIFSYFTLALNYYLGELNVFGYHLVNFIIHVVAGIFLYWFLILTFHLPSLKEKYGLISYKVALFTSLIFIAHPIQTQSVTYIVQRMTSMAGMFYLLTMVLYIKGRISSGNRRYLYFGCAGLAYLLGVFSKENVAILPLFVLIYEFYFLQNLTISPKGKKVFITLVLIVGLIALVGLVIWGKRYYELIIEGYKIRDFTLKERVLTQFRVVLYYVTLLVYPHPSRLNLDYDFTVSKGIIEPPFTLISILIVGGLLGFSLLRAKKMPILSFCILWYFGNLFIESSIFPLELVYEHRLYLPSIGPLLLFSLFVIEGLKRGRNWVPLAFLHLSKNGGSEQCLNYQRRGDKVKETWIAPIGNIKQTRFHSAEITLFVLVVFLLTSGSYLRNRIWNDEIALWTDCVRKSPHKSRPYVNLGTAYINSGQYDKALETNQKAIEINPKEACAYHNLGIIFQKIGDLNKAILMCKKALEIKPNLYIAYYTLGGIYFENSQYAESAEAFKTFLKVFPYFPEAHNRLAIAYAAQKKFDNAIVEFEWEIKINPYNALAHLNLGQIYWYEFQNSKKALYHLKAALALNPFLPNRRMIQKLVRDLEGLP